MTSTHHWFLVYFLTLIDIIENAGLMKPVVKRPNGGSSSLYPAYQVSMYDINLVFR